MIFDTWSKEKQQITAHWPCVTDMNDMDKQNGFDGKKLY